MQSQTSSQQIDWFEAERVTNDSIVDQYLQAFADSPCHDAAVLLVMYIMKIERFKLHGNGNRPTVGDGPGVPAAPSYDPWKRTVYP